MRPDITSHMKVSRSAYIRFPLGNPFGEPHQPEQGQLIFEQLMVLLETATEPDTIMELPYRWRRWRKWL